MSRRNNPYVKAEVPLVSKVVTADAPANSSLPKTHPSVQESGKATLSNRRRHRRKPRGAGSMNETATTIASDAESSEKMPPLVCDSSVERNSVSKLPAPASEVSDAKPKAEGVSQKTVSAANGPALFAQKTPRNNPEAALPKSESLDSCEWDDEAVKEEEAAKEEESKSSLGFVLL